MALAAKAWLARLPLPRWHGNAMAHLREIQQDKSFSLPIRQTAEQLSTPVTRQQTAPFTMDPSPTRTLSSNTSTHSRQKQRPNPRAARHISRLLTNVGRRFLPKQQPSLGKSHQGFARLLPRKACAPAEFYRHAKQRCDHKDFTIIPPQPTLGLAMRFTPV